MNEYHKEGTLYKDFTFRHKETGPWNIRIEIARPNTSPRSIYTQEKYVQVTFTNLNTKQKVKFCEVTVLPSLINKNINFFPKIQKVTGPYGNSYIKFTLSTKNHRPLTFFIDTEIAANTITHCGHIDTIYAIPSNVHVYENFKLYFDEERGVLSHNKKTGKTVTIFDKDDAKRIPLLTNTLIPIWHTNYVINNYARAMDQNSQDGFIFGTSGYSFSQQYAKDSDLRICFCDTDKNEMTLIRHTENDEIIKKTFSILEPSKVWYGALMEITKKEDGKLCFSIINEEDFTTHPVYETYKFDEEQEVARPTISENSKLHTYHPGKIFKNFENPQVRSIESKNDYFEPIEAVVLPLSKNEETTTYRAISLKYVHNFQEKEFTLPNSIIPIGFMPGNLFWPDTEELKNEFIILTATAEGEPKVGYISSDKFLWDPTAYVNNRSPRDSTYAAHLAAQRFAAKVKRTTILEDWATLKAAMARKAEVISQPEETDDEALFDEIVGGPK